MTRGYYTFLNDRAGVRVSGPDRQDFLQGMLTQDMNLLDQQNLLYSALLTPQGKIHYDFFVWNQLDSILLECEQNKAEALLARLRMFTLRKNVNLNIEPIQVIVLNVNSGGDIPFFFERDPRGTDLGYRALVTQPVDLSTLNEFTATDLMFYDRLRIPMIAPDGSRDIAWESDTVADLNLDKLNAVAFDKGCYLGQELTSRMHHRGLTKKGLYAVQITGEAPRPFSDILVDGNLIGEMRSSSGDMGLALLRHDSLALAERVGLKVVEPDPT